MAALVRSAASHSIYSPHTGVLAYDQGVIPIPSASLTIEDAEMLNRMQIRGQKLKICLNITSEIKGMIACMKVLDKHLTTVRNLV